MPTLQRVPTRPFRTPSMDSRRWDTFQPRDGDIVIATYPKCGTTWTQRIVDLLVFQDPAPRPFMDTAPWLDSRIFNALEEDLATLGTQSHRRFIKSHLPFDSLPIYDTVKYLHVARDGRDAFLSWHNHVTGATPQARMRIGAILAEDPEMMVGPPPVNSPDPQEFFQGWIAQAEAEPIVAPGHDLSFFDFETTYWGERHRPNLLMVNYSDMKADLVGEMRRISDFLEIDTPQTLLLELANAAQFENMKAQGAELLPTIGQMFEGAHNRFLNKGTNGRWKDILTAADLERYDAVVRRKFSPALAAWIEHGRLKAGDPVRSAD